MKNVNPFHSGEESSDVVVDAVVSSAEVAGELLKSIGKWENRMFRVIQYGEWHIFDL